MTKRKSKRRSFWLIIAGILILLYPIVATQYNDYQLHQQAESYGRSVRDIDPPTQRQQYIRAAHEYNDWLAQQGHHAYPPEPSSPGFERYLDTLNAPETGGVIARLRIPSIGIDLPVFHTTAPSVLYSGAGHMFGSSLPVGGPGTNTVISAHTGMVNASMFDNLPRLKDGETVTIDVMGETLTYKVTGREVVKPEDYDAVTYEVDKDKLTLITCTPYGINTDRLLVHAERADTQVEEESGWQPKLSWWMILALILIAAVLVIVWWNERRRKKRRSQRVS
ncbi:class C sortase [Corynebacterium sp. MSK004]|uniref:class C sortase n=1 Tax=Corynebacterium sp. MSK004 TaxID=3050186 RepID=UPI0025513D57|nr:class C sortase [Corynebacterium sp. MSK004]MDK8897649.1 class C sortase [Corynebacterium sp. MSK004]